MGIVGQTVRPNTPLYVNSFTSYGPVALANQIGLTGPNAAAGAWPAANLAIFLPFAFPFYYRVRNLFHAVGTATGGNKAIGIYTSRGTLVDAQASTAQGGANTLNFYTLPTATTIRGGFWIGLVYSVTTAAHQFGLTVTAAQGRALGLRQQAMGSVTLPTNMESTVQFATTWVPLCGITRLAVGVG